MIKLYLVIKCELEELVSSVLVLVVGDCWLDTYGRVWRRFFGIKKKKILSDFQRGIVAMLKP